MNSSPLTPDQITQFIALFAAFALIGGIICLGIYFLLAFAHYMMYKKADVKHPWLAFIPIASAWPFFWTIKKSAWNILWSLLPITGYAIALPFMLNKHLVAALSIYLIFTIGPAILGILWIIRLFKAFGINPLWLLILIGIIIPFIGFLVMVGFIVLYCYMGFSSSITYHPDFDQKYDLINGVNTPIE